MRAHGRLVLALVGCLSPRLARADHMAMHGDAATSSRFTATVSLLAAEFSNPYYVGEYEGVLPSLEATFGRFSIGASTAAYRITENGLMAYGMGDLMAHVGAVLVRTAELYAGVVFAASDPVGDYQNGLGMGHAMLMPTTWGTWSHGDFTATASGGYSRAVFLPMGNHDHGPWPLVEPMNLSELTWSLGGALAIGHGMQVGASAGGGIPVGSRPGHERVVAAARFAWNRGQVGTAAELEAAVVGDPYVVRALLETAVRF